MSDYPKTLRLDHMLNVTDDPALPPEWYEPHPEGQEYIRLDPGDVVLSAEEAEAIATLLTQHVIVMPVPTTQDKRKLHQRAGRYAAKLRGERHSTHIRTAEPAGR